MSHWLTTPHWSTEIPLETQHPRLDALAATGFVRLRDLDQAIRDPGATHLVFFAKFPARARPDQNDRIVVLRQMVNSRGVITKTSDVCRIAVLYLVHQAGAC